MKNSILKDQLRKFTERGQPLEVACALARIEELERQMTDLWATIRTPERVRLAVGVWYVRRNSGITMGELAEKSGTSASHVAKIERATVRPNEETLSRICESLGTISCGLYCNAFMKCKQEDPEFQTRIDWINGEETKQD